MACYFTIDTKSTETGNATAEFIAGGSAFAYTRIDQSEQLAKLSPYFPNWWRDDDAGNALIPA